MALFGKKKNKDDKKVESTTKTVSTTPTISKKDLSWVLKGPRITEKGAIVAELQNSYVFNIDKRATKEDVKKAVESIYKVNPVKIAITKVPSKKVQVRGKRGKFGTKSGGKKAYIYLKKGDKIEFV